VPLHRNTELKRKEVEALFNLLESGAELKECFAVIRAIFAQENVSDALLNGTYNHPEGFCSIPLGKLSQQAMIRLHLWTAHHRNAVEWLAHSHSWDVHSMVLHGEVTNRTFDISRSELGPQRLYKAPYTANGHVLEETSVSVVARELEAYTYSAGRSYHVLHGTFHSTQIQTVPLAATLVSFTNPQENIPLVIGPPNLRVQSTPHAACDRTWVCEMLSAIISSPLPDNARR
jgi:hypothetical protein